MTHIKICGITNLGDAIAASEAGADMLGFNFYPPSPRSINLFESITVNFSRIIKISSSESGLENFSIV